MPRGTAAMEAQVMAMVSAMASCAGRSARALLSMASGVSGTGRSCAFWRGPRYGTHVVQKRRSVASEWTAADVAMEALGSESAVTGDVKPGHARALQSGGHVLSTVADPGGVFVRPRCQDWRKRVCEREWVRGSIWFSHMAEQGELSVRSVMLKWRWRWDCGDQNSQIAHRSESLRARRSAAPGVATWGASTTSHCACIAL